MYLNKEIMTYKQIIHQNNTFNIYIYNLHKVMPRWLWLDVAKLKKKSAQYHNYSKVLLCINRDKLYYPRSFAQ